MSEQDKRVRLERRSNVLPLKQGSIGVRIAKSVRRFFWLWRWVAQPLVLIALLVVLFAVNPRPSEATLSQPAVFMNCDEARAAGFAPAYEGEPGYSPWLDADNDGIACEPYPSNRMRFVRGRR